MSRKAEDGLDGCLDFHHSFSRLPPPIQAPNDPLFANGTQYYMGKINVASAWTVTTGERGEEGT